MWERRYGEQQEASYAKHRERQNGLHTATENTATVWSHALPLSRSLIVFGSYATFVWNDTFAVTQLLTVAPLTTPTRMTPSP